MELLDGSGVLDVDGALGSLDPKQIDQWIAFRRLRPHPLDRIAHILMMGFSALARCGFGGAEIDPAMLDLKPPDEHADSGQDATPNQAAAVAALALGRPR